jgi:hypothetical protein
MLNRIRMWAGLLYSGHNPVTCQHGNEPSDFIKGEEFSDQLSDHKCIVIIKSMSQNCDSCYFVLNVRRPYSKRVHFKTFPPVITAVM